MAIFARESAAGKAVGKGGLNMVFGTKCTACSVDVFGKSQDAVKLSYEKFFSKYKKKSDDRDTKAVGVSEPSLVKYTTRPLCCGLYCMKFDYSSPSMYMPSGVRRRSS